MRLVRTFLLALGATAVAAVHETVDDAARHSAELVRRRGIAVMTTVMQDNVVAELAGTPFGLLEYYAGCYRNGSLAVMLADLTIAARNYREGSAVAFTIQEPANDATYSAAALRRINLSGRLVPLADPAAIEHAEMCYLAHHPDAYEWTPSRPDAPHRAAYYRFDVSHVFYFGGFGNVSYIGFVPVEKYRQNWMRSHPKSDSLVDRQ